METRHAHNVNTEVNALRPRQDGRRFADDTFKRIFFNENIRISIKISLKFVHKGPIKNIAALVQIMAWRRSGDKPLSEPMMVSLPTHICVTRPQWVNFVLEHNILSTSKTYSDALWTPICWANVKWNPHNSRCQSWPLIAATKWFSLHYQLENKNFYNQASKSHIFAIFTFKCMFWRKRYGYIAVSAVLAILNQCKLGLSLQLQQVSSS